MGRKRIKTQASTSDDSEDEVTSKRSRINEDKENLAQNSRNAVLQTYRTVKLRDLETKIQANLRSGKIKRIYLQNFMCHSNFEVNLNKCINIIVGLNGSGKSAILTAISIGLGGKASSTARSTNLKELVKRGEPSATIEITLANDGVDSYEHDVYGDEIIIVRTISANSGSSSYKIKAQNGRTISTTRQELHKMSLCLNIQVENPVLILNQDAARSFLKECDPKKLYQFFMKATQIEAIIEKLNGCFQTAVSSKNQLGNVEKAMKKYEVDIEALRQKISRLSSVRSLRNKIDEYKNEIEWIRVKLLEQELATSNTNLIAKREEVRKISDLINNKDKNEKQGREKIRELGTIFQQLQFESENNNVRHETARKDFERERDKLSELENSHKSAVDKLAKRVMPNIQQLENDIAEHENNPSNVENLRLENEAQIESVEKKIAENSAVLNNYKRDFQMFMQTCNDEKEKAEELRAQMQREQGKITHIDQQIHQCENAGKDTLSIYGGSAGRLLKELEVMYKQKKFTQLPKAFLGRYIEVPDKKYRQAVETILRNYLTSFIVNCDKDRLVLADVLKKYNDLTKIQIITTEFVDKVYDVRRGMVNLQSPGAVLFNVIKVSDPVVMNCLIDQCRIERIVLVENIESAIHLTQDERTVPKNLSRVMLLKPLSEYYPAPNYRSYSVREQPLRFIQTNFTEIIKDLVRQKTDLERKYDMIRHRVREANGKIQEFDKYSNEKKRQMSDLQQKEKQYYRKLEELRAVEFPENTDINYLKTELEGEKRRKAAFEKKIDESKEKLNQFRAIVDNFKQKMDEQLKLYRESREKMQKVQQENDKLQKFLNSMKHEIETKGRQIKNLQEEEMTIENRVKELENLVRNMTGKIKGKRVESHRTEDDLDKAIKMTEKRIQGIESTHENIEDVEQQLESKTQLLENTKNIHRALDNVLKKLTNLRESRYMYVRKLRQHMSLRMKHKFHQLMQLRNYSAEIEIDHKEQKLQLKIIPRDADVDGAVSNTKALSGGERSYSTVSFLLSLWSCVDHPFYFLDEYDVFSDEYNRHMMTMLLLNEAEKKKDKQFGFLTPQEFSNVTASDYITIHKLQDPERHN
ncbi:structural maintenance of chromosomes protein 6 isoform X2 [Chironomus tepperi]|uniref:structural maintenance of chromosomes protein 6 isoform X2 n=1 Tax=Chironomus tepperi TaxID=113505 RepID=UPI00391FB131